MQLMYLNSLNWISMLLSVLSCFACSCENTGEVGTSRISYYSVF